MNHRTDKIGQDKHRYSGCCNCDRFNASALYLRICHCQRKIGHAPWSRISFYNQCLFHFPGCKYYSECFENTKNQGIDRKAMEKASFEDGSKYNHHRDTKYRCGLYDGTIRYWGSEECQCPISTF